MQNIYAYQLSRAVKNANIGGDYIDHGWSLVKALNAAGFDVVPRDRRHAGQNPARTLNDMCHLKNQPPFGNGQTQNTTEIRKWLPDKWLDESIPGPQPHPNCFLCLADGEWHMTNEDGGNLGPLSNGEAVDFCALEIYGGYQIRIFPGGKWEIEGDPWPEKANIFAPADDTEAQSDSVDTLVECFCEDWSGDDPVILDIDAWWWGEPVTFVFCIEDGHARFEQPVLSIGMLQLAGHTEPGTPTHLNYEHEFQTFQNAVKSWMIACFGETIAGDRTERNHRFLEEALEIVQAGGTTKSEANQLVDYVYGRPVGELPQEVGGGLVTLAGLCDAYDIDMMDCAWKETVRIWRKRDQIREKQARKPKNSPLPQAVRPTDE